MDIAIWGTKKEAVYIAGKLGQDKQNKIVCFIDNDEKKWGCYISGRPVCSPAQLEKMYHHQIDTVILAVRNGYSILCILKQLKLKGITNIGITKLSVYDFCEEVSVNREDTNILWIDGLKKTLIPYLQIILVTTCNLNCKGCTHFANLFNKGTDKNIYNVDMLNDHMKRLSQNTEVFRLRLLGGEPLLHPSLKTAIEVVHKYFPNSDIRLVTNGLLLLKASTELLHCISNNNIGLDISPYKPTVKMKEKIVTILKNYNIKYNFEGIEQGYIEIFEKNININGENNPEKSMAACPHKQCITLMDGKLYKCPFAVFSKKFFEYFSIRGGNIENGFEIDKENINWKELIDKLYTCPIDSCKYCSDKIEKFEWINKINPEYLDWMVL